MDSLARNTVVAYYGLCGTAHCNIACCVALVAVSHDKPAGLDWVADRDEAPVLRRRVAADDRGERVPNTMVVEVVFDLLTRQSGATRGAVSQCCGEIGVQNCSRIIQST